MKKSIFFLLAVMMTISFTSCYDDIYPNVNDRGVPLTVDYLRLIVLVYIGVK